MTPHTRHQSVLLRNHQNCIPLSACIKDGDNVVLLTPVVVPVSRGDYLPDGKARDPFETFASGLLSHSPRPRIHHVPYTARGGIGETHLEIIERTEPKLIIFIASGPPVPGQTSQLVMARVLWRKMAGHRLMILLAALRSRDLMHLDKRFKTIVRINGYSPADLRGAITTLYRRLPDARPRTRQMASSAPKTWEVAIVNSLGNLPHLLDEIHQLWQQCLGQAYQLPVAQLGLLLERGQNPTHYLVRESSMGALIGFCATFTKPSVASTERLVGSLAVVMVRPGHRGRGVGRSLHEVALAQLSRTKGVYLLQLGSSFPRLLWSLPARSPAEAWFTRRGWNLDKNLPCSLGGSSSGQDLCNWLLRFDDYIAPTHLARSEAVSGSSRGGDGLNNQEIVFRACKFSEMPAVLELVAAESSRKRNMGWYDQYSQLNQPDLAGDIVVGVVSHGIVAAAITYIPDSENPVVDDLPWADLMSTGDDCYGGMTCICTSDEPDEYEYETSILAPRSDRVFMGLVDACVQRLKRQDMKGMLIDAIGGTQEGLVRTGFKKQATYRNTWRVAL